jgi:hypothetical protein
MSQLLDLASDVVAAVTAEAEVVEEEGQGEEAAGEDTVVHQETDILSLRKVPSNILNSNMLNRLHNK